MKKRTLFIIIINALCLIGIAVCQTVSSSIISPLNSGQAAKAWAGQSGERFAQLSVFLPAANNFSDDARRQLHNSLDMALRNSSLEADENRRLYADAWSADGTVNVKGQRGSATASVIGVGGDFFLFHPLYLRSGSYISQSDVMRDRVVLDEDLAWRLYGSVNLAGLEVVINERPFVIAGVVAREIDRASSAAYSGGAGMYMSYELLEVVLGSAPNVNCYEIVMPDLVTDFALTTLTEALNNESYQIIDNTSRFSLPHLFDLIGQFGERSMQRAPIIYPYWENAARYAEDWAAMLLFVSLVFAVCPVVFAVIYAVRLVLIGIRELKYAIGKYIKRRDDKAYAKYLAEQG